MLHKTKGIVINYIRYGESSIITKIYTEQFGAQSYIINGVRSQSKQSKMGLFQPLTLLDLVVYYKEHQINRISEMKCSTPFKTLHTDLKKGTVTLFLSEILNRILTAEEEHQELFEFMEESLIRWDQSTEGSGNFHLQFLLQLTRHLGLEISTAEDLKSEVELHRALPAFTSEMAAIINLLIEKPIAEPIALSHQQRRLILEYILFFYQQQLGVSPDLRSLQILREVFG